MAPIPVAAMNGSNMSPARKAAGWVMAAFAITSDSFSTTNDDTSALHEKID